MTKIENMSDSLHVATLGGGCFWCVETVYNELKGVHSAVSGYEGGKIKNPSYREMCTGLTGHAEVVQITFDSQVISYEQLLRVFWTVHDPTTLNRQGADMGTQYRSVIFFFNEEQRILAEKSKQEVATQLWDAPIVTEISPSTVFYPAETYHQRYFEANPMQSYCQVVINPKVMKFRKEFKELLKSS